MIVAAFIVLCHCVRLLFVDVVFIVVIFFIVIFLLLVSSNVPT